MNMCLQTENKTYLEIKQERLDSEIKNIEE